MKKYFVYLMMALAAVTFNACSDDDPLQKEPETEQPGNQDDNEGTENPDEPNTPDEPSGDSNNILVAYFSWGGTTQRMAQQIVLIPKIIPNVQKWHWKNGTAMPVLP